MATSALNVNPKFYGHRLIPTLIDELAENDPNRLFCLISSLSGSPRTVHVHDFAQSINRASQWMESTLGRGEDFETLAYLGPNDLRYFIFLVAAIKVGYKLLLPSPRNSIQNHLHVFEKTGCKTMLQASVTRVDHILAQRNMRSITVPELEELLSAGPVQHYPYGKTFEEAEADPAFVLHSSGSTGPPKPIVYTHGSVASFDAHHLLPSEPGRVHIWKAVPEGTKMLLAMPFFHLSGLFTGLMANLYWNLPTVHLPPNSIMNANTVLDALDATDPDAAFVAPSILEEMSHSSHALAKLSNLSFIWYGGGPISDYAGDIICKHTRIISLIGSTEAGMYPIYLPDSREDFAYFRFDPDVPGIEFQERADDLYELVMTRAGNVDYQATFKNFPELDSYPTKDLYRKHPSEPHYWKHVSRADDVIVLSNGEKVVGIPMENTVRQAPEVDEIIVLGNGRFQVAALIELRDPALGALPGEMVEQLAPYIKHANEMAPGFARLSKDRILFTNPEKPMMRTAKGSVIRKGTLMQYDNEINSLYSRAMKSEGPTGPLLKCNDVALTERTLLKILTSVSEIPELSVEQDMFQAGLDSLQVLSTVRQIKSIIESEAPEHAHNVVASLVYSNPSIKQLAIALRAMADPSKISRETLHARNMEETLSTLSKDLPQAIFTRDYHHITVILTGSTGSLGSYLLDTLTSDPLVAKVYALNRSVDGETKQYSANSSRGLSTNFDKVVFLQSTLGEERFGLDHKTYEQLSLEVSAIIHNAWPVDFNLALDSFLPHVRGVRHFIDFSATSVKKPPIFFTSSVSTTGNWPKLHPNEPIPEQVIGDVRIPLSIGYGESKYVSEHLLNVASEAGVSAAILRVGQVAGPIEKGGMWSKQEWLPSLIASSNYLRLLPSALGPSGTTIDWIPVDRMACIISELVAHNLRIPFAPNPAWTSVYNLTNPHPVEWASLIPAIQTHLSSETKVVPYSEWLDALRASAESEKQDPVANPAIKLLDFFEAMGREALPAGYSTEGAKGASATMREMDGVKGEWMEGWLKTWAF